jgi:hypothetical protein
MVPFLLQKHVVLSGRGQLDEGIVLDVNLVIDPLPHLGLLRTIFRETLL